MSNLPEDSETRKRMPVFSGFMNYFPRAIAAVAAHSLKANEKHNPGQPLHWSHEKSADHVDCIARHLLDLNAVDEFGDKHDVSVAWRAMALLETRLRNEEWTQTTAEAQVAHEKFVSFLMTSEMKAYAAEVENEPETWPQVADIRINSPLDMGLGGELADVVFSATFSPIYGHYRVSTDRYDFRVNLNDLDLGYAEIVSP